MRRVTGIGACIALMLGAGTAIAGDGPSFPQPENQFEGTMSISGAKDAQTYIGFNVERKNGKKSVRNVFVRAKFNCPGQKAGYEQFPVKGTFAVKRGRFGGVKKFTLAPPEQSPAHFRVILNGDLKRKRASGDFKFRVSIEGSSTPCVGPLRNWSARRGAEVEPETKPSMP